MFGRRFEYEQRLIEDAQRTEIGEKTLREYVKPMVLAVIDEFLKEHRDVSEQRHVLLARAWKYLSLAVQKYKERSEKMIERTEPLYYFETYFRWFVRQALIEYVEGDDQ